MRNICKKLLFSGLLAVSGVAFAGPLDGVYSCSTTVPGVGSIASTNVVVTNAQGVTGFSVLSISANTQSYGYGLGTATTTSFVGTDMNGKPFAFVVSGTTITGSLFFNNNGQFIASTSSCLKIW